MLVMFRNRLLRFVRVRAERCVCRAVFIVSAESYTEMDAPQPNANSMRLLLVLDHLGITHALVL